MLATLPLQEYFRLPPHQRPPKCNVESKRLYSPTEAALSIAQISVRLQMRLREIVAETGHRILAAERRPCLQEAVALMGESARYLFSTRNVTLTESTFAWLPAWKHELTQTTSSERHMTGGAIMFGGNCCGGNYIDAALMLGDAMIAAVCKMSPDKVGGIHEVDGFLPQMPDEQSLVLLESESLFHRIRQCLFLIDLVLEDWPEYPAFQSLCVQEFVCTVERLGIHTPTGEPWSDYLCRQEPVPVSQTTSPPEDQAGDSSSAASDSNANEAGEKHGRVASARPKRGAPATYSAQERSLDNRRWKRWLAFRKEKRNSKRNGRITYSDFYQYCMVDDDDYSPDYKTFKKSLMRGKQYFIALRKSRDTK